MKLKTKYLVLLTSVLLLLSLLKTFTVKNKIPNITNLVTTTSFTAVENRIHNVSNLVKLFDYNTKINEIEIKLLLIMIMINILLFKNLIN